MSPAEPVDWLARCALPRAWGGQPQWRMLDMRFGCGLRFLQAWRAWKDDPARPGLLHYVALDASAVVTAQELQAHAVTEPLLALQLAAQCWGLVPGFHRLTFEGGRVLLILCIGDTRSMLRAQAFSADTVVLDAACLPADPAPQLHALKSIARLCRRGSRLVASAASAVPLPGLLQCGFQIDRPDADDAVQGAWLRAVFAPAWEPRGRRAPPARTAGHCIVVGAGLAGAAAAASLARRGWQVRVLDAAQEPASGASGLPAGLLAPQLSPDDNLLSRLSRSGVRIALQQAQALLEPHEFQTPGVLEHRIAGASGWQAPQEGPAAQWSTAASAEQRRLAGLGDAEHVVWHAHAGWIKPSALVRAWLAQPGIRWCGGVTVASILRQPDGWQMLDASGAEVGRADLVVVAAAHACAGLLSAAVPQLAAALPLQPVRGQLSWGPQADSQAHGHRLPPFPVNGDGHFIAGVLHEGRHVWLCGSTFGRGETDTAARAADHRANFERLQSLLTDVARQLAPAFADGSVQAWTGIRCSSADRRPLLGELAPGLWLSTAMGSRGLTFAALCAELLAARLHGEPLPLERKLAAALDVARAIGSNSPSARLTDLSD